MSKSRFSISTIAGKSIIHDSKTNLAGELYQNEQKQWMVKIYLTESHLSNKKREGLEKRMADWYVFTQLKK